MSSSSTNGNAANGGNAYGGQKGDTQFRKEWNKEEFEKKAEVRRDEERKKASEKRAEGGKRNIDLRGGKLAVAREESLTLDSNLNKSFVINAVNEPKGPGFHCRYCNLTYKDNLSYLDHLNSPIHLKNTGTSNRIERSTVAEVAARLEARRQRKLQPTDPTIILENRLKKEAAEREAKKLAKKQRNQVARGDHDHQDIKIQNGDDEMAAMGFSGFGSSKVK